MTSPRLAADNLAHAGSLHEVPPAAGGNPAVVFLHGLGGTNRYWTCATPPLPDAAYVDLYGFGDSPRPLLRYTLERHLAALRTALVGRSGYVLVGHSLGAALALAYAARYPDDVEALLLLGLPHYGGRKAAYRWLRRHPAGWVTTNMLVTAAVCVFTRRVVGRLLPRLLPSYPRAVAEDLVKHNMLSSTTSLWEVLYRRDLTVDADALPDRIRVHCLHGAEDASAPHAGVHALADGRPGWRVTVLPGVDHHPWLRAPEVCVRALTELIADTAGGGDR